ncbi:hypothetical protein BT96DRAFT_944353 [Gymnopus androsaceus JB14]|uniref:Uncharacterized protein n=1 Tax=Gymnopus androsaceus JB14 TaxID=1447944 RepID=A0A6A4H4U5_9AGAR|nr:hypothetical protein BT96DRAFT_944353 [Gymnopus androsaceus JB14]
MEKIFDLINRHRGIMIAPYIMVKEIEVLGMSKHFVEVSWKMLKRITYDGKTRTPILKAFFIGWLSAFHFEAQEEEAERERYHPASQIYTLLPTKAFIQGRNTTLFPRITPRKRENNPTRRSGMVRQKYQESDEHKSKLLATKEWLEKRLRTVKRDEYLP